ncbi:peptidase M23 [Bacillus sp. BRMEA1]|uniref:peptidase M23 n=1 Tax=Neobacillus endophyticus TaxID=2738405 RepID=UPI001565FCD7|nr:peptidase M23 [Neobacillus endophyticus]NRD80843.1 peptidase M23 [Neobacillus endophyticus]
MSTALRTILLVVLFAFIMSLQVNLDADKTSTFKMKNALELAVHDGALALSSADLANGKIVFDQNAALNNIQASLDTNLNLTSNAGYVYTPNANSFFKNNLYLVDLEFIDDNVTTTYPYIYNNPNYNISKTVNGPSIIAIMTTDSPRWFNGSDTIIRQAAVYEYKK